MQYLELNTFQIRFREIANAFADDFGRLERDVPTGGFASEDEANDAIDKLDSLARTVAADVAKVGGGAAITRHGNIRILKGPLARII